MATTRNDKCRSAMIGADGTRAHHGKLTGVLESIHSKKPAFMVCENHLSGYIENEWVVAEKGTSVAP